MNTFTPYIHDEIEGLKILRNSDVDRVEMELDDEDYDKIKRGEEWKAIVTDQNTGRTFEVAGAPCSLPTCFCAARIVREIT